MCFDSYCHQSKIKCWEISRVGYFFLAYIKLKIDAKIEIHHCYLHAHVIAKLMKIF